MSSSRELLLQRRRFVVGRSWWRLSLLAEAKMLEQAALGGPGVFIEEGKELPAKLAFGILHHVFEGERSGDDFAAGVIFSVLGGLASL